MTQPVATPATHITAVPPTSPAHEERLFELGEEIALLSARISSATYQLLVLLRRFDKTDGWTGFRSCAEWLSWRTGLELGASREKVRVARSLAVLPLISESMACGELSYSKVRALTRIASPDNEEELVETAKAVTASQLERIVRGWRKVDRQAEADRDERRRSRRYLRVHTDDDGMLVIRARLEPEAGAALQRALEAAEEDLFREESRQAAEARRVSAEISSAEAAETDDEERLSTDARRADALALIAERSLSPDGVVRAADRFQVVVHVGEGQAGFAVLEGGPGVSAEIAPGQAWSGGTPCER